MLSMSQFPEPDFLEILPFCAKHANANVLKVTIHENNTTSFESVSKLYRLLEQDFWFAIFL